MLSVAVSQVPRAEALKHVAHGSLRHPHGPADARS